MSRNSRLMLLPLVAAFSGVLAGPTFSTVDADTAPDSAVGIPAEASTQVSAQTSADRSADTPKAEMPEASSARPASSLRLVKPWSTIADLTDDQRREIYRIHRDALKKIRDVKEQERETILAVLTPEQRQQYDTMMDEERAAEKVKRAEQAEAPRAKGTLAVGRPAAE